MTRRRGLNEIHKVDHILIDEFHHFGAEVWGDALQELIEENPEAYVLGTSATPVRPEGMIDTVDLYFEGNLFYELTLPQAWYCSESWIVAAALIDIGEKYKRNWMRLGLILMEPWVSLK